ncbi:MAG: TIGR03435 family protein [Terracidiphilus sp.]
MVPQILAVALTLSPSGLQPQSLSPRPAFDAFEVATIKPAPFNAKASRYIVMRGADTFVEKDYTLKLLIAAAYDLNPRQISGGAGWVESDHYDIQARTPGAVRPTHDEQMRMLRNLLADRFKLTFHREQKEFSIYELETGKGGPKLKPSTAPADDPPALISTVYAEKIVMPARNATMGDFVRILQRAVLDRPVVDKTGLSGRYDFDLTWAPDATQFGGEVPVAPPTASSPPFFTAIREQLGLRLVATRGPAEALVIDGVERPSPN